MSRTFVFSRTQGIMWQLKCEAERWTRYAGQDDVCVGLAMQGVHIFLLRFKEGDGWGLQFPVCSFRNVTKSTLRGIKLNYTQMLSKFRAKLLQAKTFLLCHQLLQFRVSSSRSSNSLFFRQPDSYPIMSTVCVWVCVCVCVCVCVWQSHYAAEKSPQGVYWSLEALRFFAFISGLKPFEIRCSILKMRR